MRIEGESPPLGKGTYGLRSIGEADASRRMAANPAVGPSFETRAPERALLRMRGGRYILTL
jgi:hypothetical protein